MQLCFTHQPGITTFLLHQKYITVCHITVTSLYVTSLSHHCHMTHAYVRSLRLIIIHPSQPPWWLLEGLRLYVVLYHSEGLDDSVCAARWHEELQG